MTEAMTEPITEYLCIGCPLGCRLEVEESADDSELEVRGFTCKKGKEYGRQEHTDPRRTVTTTVRLAGAGLVRLPVRTNGTVPKAAVRDVCRLLQGIEVDAPVSMGSVIVPDVLGTGIDVIATRDMPAEPSGESAHA